MESIKISNQIEDINEKIRMQLDEAKEAFNKFNLDKDINDFKASFNNWRSNTIRLLKLAFQDNTISDKFSMETAYVPNRLSNKSTETILSEATHNGIRLLLEIQNELRTGVYNKESSYSEFINQEVSTIDKDMALIIIRRILMNYYKHIKAMYQDKVHGNGTIRQEDLSKIQIRNEYDVQRILYGIIKPIFPKARLEVVEDDGYKSVRYDIYVDEYSIAIEVKCSRKNMTERILTEELGSDAFHYKAESLFMFIYDKEKIIKNADAFVDAYKREKCNFGKNVEAIVIQQVEL